MKIEAFDNVWDAIEDDPAVAENLKLRSLLMIELERHIKREGMTQARAAKVFGVTQPRVSNLIHGKINLVQPRFAGEDGDRGRIASEYEGEESRVNQMGRHDVQRSHSKPATTNPDAIAPLLRNGCRAR